MDLFELLLELVKHVYIDEDKRTQMMIWIDNSHRDGDANARLRAQEQGIPDDVQVPILLSDVPTGA